MLTARSHLAGSIPLYAVLVLLLTIIGFDQRANAAAPSQPSQEDVEEVYLFDFAKFIQWPAGADQGQLHICVAGAESFTAGLQRIIANENIGSRTLDVRRVARPADEPGCAILFIDSTQRTHIDELLHGLADKPTLTVSDAPEFLARGGMIQFQLVEKRVRFSVNLDAVARGHLSMSSELLKVALTVKGKSPEGGAE